MRYPDPACPFREKPSEKLKLLEQLPRTNFSYLEVFRKYPSHYLGTRSPGGSAFRRSWRCWWGRRATKPTPKSPAPDIYSLFKKRGGFIVILLSNSGKS